MPEWLGDGPIEEQYIEQMNHLAHLLNAYFNPEYKTTGFCLMVFPFAGFNGRANYISNANREDVITLLKEQLARFQGQPEASGRA